ncbi:hypothetical protein AAC387_Pa01g1799 [Persea americana]
MAPFLVFILTSFLTILVFQLYQRLRFRLPPGPRPWPIIGNLYDIKPVIFQCFSEWSQTHGPIMSVWYGSSLNVIVCNAELAKEVLKEKDQQLADRPRDRLRAKLSRDGKDLIWADYGPHNVKVRKVCTLELFSHKRLESLRPIREDEVTAMIESIFRDITSPGKLGERVVVKNYVSAVALNNITRLVLGKRFVNSDGVMEKQGVEFKAIGANTLRLRASLTMAEHIPWLRWMFPLEKEAMAKHSTRRDQLSKAIMEDHTLARHRTSEKQHFVDALLTLKDKYDLSDDTIIGLLWDMIIAGVDTNVTSVEWAMAELIKNPRVQEKVQEELDRVIGSKRVMNEMDFPNLPYLKCVVKEAFRLHPPTPMMLPHKATAHVKVGGYDIPKGSIVQVNVWAIAHDPAVWKDPLEFRPERFIEEEIDLKGHDFRLLPFGAGRRVCPGAQLGINLVQLMLGHLLHHFHWAPPKGVKAEEIDMSGNPGVITFMRTPLEAVPTPRLPPHLYKRVAVDM